VKNDLKERYIYAVTRHLPTRQQADVARELGGLINEMLDERSGNSPADIKDVLEELGPPEELALKYCGEQRTSLISGAYYLMYMQVLRTVLPIVAGIAALISLVSYIIDSVAGGFSFPNIFAGGFAVFGSVFQTFAIITIIFAIMEHFKTKINVVNMLDSLPDIPEGKARISIGETVFDIVFTIAWVVVLLGFPQLFSARADGQWIPVFDLDTLRGLWLPIVLWAAFSVMAELVKLIEGRYTMRLAMVTLVANVIIAMGAIAIFGNSNLVNPDFITFMADIMPDIGFAPIYAGIENMNIVVLVIILIITAIETLYTFGRALFARG